jgi:hypothetical protein
VLNPLLESANGCEWVTHLQEETISGCPTSKAELQPFLDRLIGPRLSPHVTATQEFHLVIIEDPFNARKGLLFEGVLLSGTKGNVENKDDKINVIV